MHSTLPGAPGSLVRTAPYFIHQGDIVNQTQQQTKRSFSFPAGTGVIRARIANAEAGFAVMHFGRIALPGLGQCYIDGHRAADATSMELDIRKPTAEGGRTTVAKLLLPVLGRGKSSVGAIVLGKIVTTGPKRSRLTWKCTGEVRIGENGFHLALRLPDVKIAAGAF